MATGSERINFSPEIRRLAAERAGYRCSFPDCGKTTIGPGPDADTTFCVGEAAHIYSASPNGPRGQGGLSDDTLKSIRNCIWLCRTHSGMVDLKRGTKFPASVLYGYRDLHESRVSRELGDLPSMKGWVESVTLGQNPLFASGTRLLFGKSTVLHGHNGTGKTALLEWMASVFSSEPASRWSDAAYELDICCLDSVRAHDLKFAFREGRSKSKVDDKAVPYNPLDFSFLFVVKDSGIGKSPVDRIAQQLGVSPRQAESLIEFLGKDPKSPVTAASVSGDNLSVTFRNGRAKEIAFVQLSEAEKQLVVIECALVQAAVVAEHRPVMLCLDADFGAFDKVNTVSVLQRVSSPDLRFQTVVVLHDDRADMRGWQVYDFVGRKAPRRIEPLYGS